MGILAEGNFTELFLVLLTIKYFKITYSKTVSKGPVNLELSNYICLLFVYYSCEETNLSITKNPADLLTSSKRIRLTTETWYIDGLVQDCSIQMANALQILRSCTQPSICKLYDVFLWHYNHNWVSLVVADNMAPSKHQGISNHHGGEGVQEWRNLFSIVTKISYFVNRKMAIGCGSHWYHNETRCDFDNVSMCQMWMWDHLTHRHNVCLADNLTVFEPRVWTNKNKLERFVRFHIVVPSVRRAYPS